jgi:hypothetical protein
LTGLEQKIVHLCRSQAYTSIIDHGTKRFELSGTYGNTLIATHFSNGCPKQEQKYGPVMANRHTRGFSQLTNEKEELF